MRLLSRQEHLNKINVFPVPDGDTGTNLALTMSAVLGTLQQVARQHAGQDAHARGRCGARWRARQLRRDPRAVLPRRVRQARPPRRPRAPADFADGVHGGAAYARESLSEPREGTILTVLSDFAHEVQPRARGTGVRDLRALLRRGVTAAEQSLARTTQQLEALRKANVVDAGAPGFRRVHCRRHRLHRERHRGRAGGADARGDRRASERDDGGHRGGPRRIATAPSAS